MIHITYTHFCGLCERKLGEEHHRLVRADAVPPPRTYCRSYMGDYLCEPCFAPLDAEFRKARAKRGELKEPALPELCVVEIA